MMLRPVRSAVFRSVPVIAAAVFAAIALPAVVEAQGEAQAAAQAAVQAGSERLPRFAPPDSAEIREPLFDFVLNMMAADSLGIWLAGDIDRHLQSLGRESLLPLDRLVSLERRAAPADRALRLRGLISERIWILTLDGEHDFPMPYSILGYHPGSLVVSEVIEVSEWRLGDLDLVAGEGDDRARYFMADTVVLRLESGHIVLDVDAWLDELLGKGLDDTWTTGFAVARCDDGWVGLGLGRGRRGRRLYGAFDFASDKVKPHGDDREKALVRVCRPFTRIPADSPSRPWSWDR